MKTQKKVIALNFPSKNGLTSKDRVTVVNLYTDLCGNPDFEDTAYLSSQSYQEIFGKPRSIVGRQRKLLSVLRIKNKETGRVIYRKYNNNPRFSGLKDEMIALHPASIRELTIENNSEIVGKPVEVGKGNYFCYYWNHPFHATRISMKLGTISVFLAILSIIITIVLSSHCS